MNLLDSNIVIGAASPEGAAMDRTMLETPYAYSVVTRIEVLGYPRLTADDEADLHAFLAAGRELPLDEAVARKAVQLRQERRMSLGDSIIAATALVHQVPLWTRNVQDFKHIAGLELRTHSVRAVEQC
jgi:predicted nucleic acid-binding protein